jgi:hypothetical protein
MSDTGARWYSDVRRSDGLTIDVGDDGVFVIMPADARAPPLRTCPCCDRPLLTPRAAMLVADQVYPLEEAAHMSGATRITVYSSSFSVPGTIVDYAAIGTVKISYHAPGGFRADWFHVLGGGRRSGQRMGDHDDPPVRYSESPALPDEAA